MSRPREKGSLRISGLQNVVLLSCIDYVEVQGTLYLGLSRKVTIVILSYNSGL